MKPHIVVVGAIIGFLIFKPYAFAGPDDCTTSVITLIRGYLIESIVLDDAFTFLDAGDCVGALDHFEQSAEKGNLDAQNNVGVIYESGLGVHADLERARQWYRKAAQEGLAEAQWNLAAVILTPHSNVNLFDTLRPIRKPKTPDEMESYRDALMWSIAAAENGHPMAPRGVRRLRDVLPESEVSAARSGASKWITP